MTNKKSGLLVGLLTGTLVAVLSYFSLPKEDKDSLLEDASQRVDELQANISRLKNYFDKTK